jgi:hypothetical protein
MQTHHIDRYIDTEFLTIKAEKRPKNTIVTKLDVCQAGPCLVRGL